jgi:hypothetical protein
MQNRRCKKSRQRAVFQRIFKPTEKFTTTPRCLSTPRHLIHFVGHFDYFFRFWYVGPRKIWQPCLRECMFLTLARVENFHSRKRTPRICAAGFSPTRKSRDSFLKGFPLTTNSAKFPIKLSRLRNAAFTKAFSSKRKTIFPWKKLRINCDQK